jgi:hypothetical protein
MGSTNSGGVPMKRQKSVLCLLLLFCTLAPVSPARAATDKHFLYVASPGIRNYVEFGGVGILVFDIDAGYKFVKRIPTWEVPAGKAAENVKGVAANARTAKIYVSQNASRPLICSVKRKFGTKSLRAVATVWRFRPTGGQCTCPHLRGHIGWCSMP